MGCSLAGGEAGGWDGSQAWTQGTCQSKDQQTGSRVGRGSWSRWTSKPAGQQRHHPWVSPADPRPSLLPPPQSDKAVFQSKQPRTMGNISFCPTHRFIKRPSAKILDPNMIRRKVANVGRNNHHLSFSSTGLNGDQEFRKNAILKEVMNILLPEKRF